MDGSSEYLTTTRSGQLLGASPAYILQLHRQGRLRAIRVEGAGGKPGPRLFLRRDVMELAAQRVVTHLRTKRSA